MYQSHPRVRSGKIRSGKGREVSDVCDVDGAVLQKKCSSKLNLHVIIKLEKGKYQPKLVICPYVQLSCATSKLEMWLNISLLANIKMNVSTLL